jgi:hypothetical protein
VRAAAQQQLAMYQLSLRAQQGDTTAVRQLMELQQQFAAQYNAQAAAMYGAQAQLADSLVKSRAKSARKP